jgi:hypothetical protein
MYFARRCKKLFKALTEKHRIHGRNARSKYTELNNPGYGVVAVSYSYTKTGFTETI